jgi:hypothetical protein
MQNILILLGQQWNTPHRRESRTARVPMAPRLLKSIHTLHRRWPNLSTYITSLYIKSIILTYIIMISSISMKIYHIT